MTDSRDIESDRTIARQRRLLMGASGALIVMALLAAGGLYTQLVQRRPQIIAVALPIPNANVDASGTSFQAWSKRGDGLTLAASRNQDRAWRPVPVEEFRPGDTVWVRRDSCYVDKAAVRGVEVELIGTGAATGRRFVYDPVDPPKRTVPVKSANPERPDGPAGPFGHCAAFNYPYRLPPLLTEIIDPDDPAKTRKILVPTKGTDGRPLWIAERAEWIIRLGVRFLWALILRPVAYHPDTWITVEPVKGRE